MSWILFLDDEREPTWELNDPKIAQTTAEAVKLIRELGVPAVISFDHDLGKREPTGLDLVHWLIDEHLDGRLDLNAVRRVIVHSANPVGAQNIRGLWDGFATHELVSGVLAELRPRTSNFK